MPLTAGQRIGAYEITAALGAGGMGEVYRAKDSRLKREVALKVLPADVANDRERMARFQREAEVLASLNHPHIAQIYGLEDNALVMELVEGEDLAERLNRGPIPIDEALPIAKQIAEALEAAHEQGIIHRDLKPANIKVRPDGTVKVLDFGLAKALGPSEGDGRQAEADASALRTITSPAMTMRGVILGTAAYMAPEQAKGKPVDKRADIWAFGVVLYEMLTGQRAFAGEDTTDTIVAVVSKSPDWSALPEATPPAVGRLLKRCLEKDRKQRLRDIGDAQHELSDYALAAGSPASAPAGASRRWWASAGWVAAAVVSVALVATVFYRPAATAPTPGEVVRFEIQPPEGREILRRAGTLALSADGRKLAFVGRLNTMVASLYIRPLSAIESEPIRLTGTAGTDTINWAAALFSWSPDGRFLLVTSSSARGGPVRRIDAASGLSITLAEWGQDAVWGSAGSVIYTGMDGRIYRVPEDGGAREPLTEIDSNAGEVAHRASAFLADGRRFIYVAQNRDPSKNAAYVASVDRAAPAPVPNLTSPALLAGGFMWYLQGDALVARRFDMAQGRPSGEARRIAEGVVDFTVSATTLVTRFRVAGNVSMTWIGERSNASVAIGPTAAYDGLPRADLSPDQRQLAFTMPDANDNRDIYLLDLTRNVPLRIVADAAQDESPIFSPDGKHIVFASNRSGTFGLYRRASDGSGVDELLYDSPLRKIPSGFSPDGAELLFHQTNVGTGADIYALPTSGDRTPRPIVATRALEGHARFSPDGRWIAYCAGEPGEGDQVYVEPYPPTGSRTRLSIEQGQAPQWSRDGRQVYFGMPDGQIMRVPLTFANGTIRPGVPQAVVSAPNLFDHSSFVLDPVAARVLALSVGTRRAPLTVTLNWPELFRTDR